MLPGSRNELLNSHDKARNHLGVTPCVPHVFRMSSPSSSMEHIYQKTLNIEWKAVGDPGQIVPAGGGSVGPWRLELLGE